ncbi:MAG TPA: hypothetical protein PKH77_12960 [Anaerolineae bacterium]|nr:hypothetical protein [Anaerolineae bacterium]
MLDRHNAVATDVLGNDGACWLVVVHYEMSSGLNLAPDLPGVAANWTQAMSFDTPDNPFVVDDTPNPMTVWTTQIPWRRGRYDDLIRLVADDQEPHVLIVAFDSGRIYHPYDGGADLLLESSSVRDALKSSYAAWLSKHPQGL